MTVEEIKQAYSMREIVERYGVKVKRDGMCCCPFHKEKHASMKVYKDSYHCFACNESGDIFTFVQKMDRCDFKTAFYSLGGSYAKSTNSSKIALHRSQKAKEKRQLEEKKQKDKLFRYIIDAHAYRQLYQEAEVRTDEFWEYLQKYDKALIMAEITEGGA